MPIKDSAGSVVAVQPIRGIVASNGLWYSGVLAHDAEGNAFTYNQVPNDYSPEPIIPKKAVDANGRVLVDALGRRIMLRG